MAIWEARNSSGLIFFGSIVMLEWKTFKEQAEGCVRLLFCCLPSIPFLAKAIFSLTPSKEQLECWKLLATNCTDPSLNQSLFLAVSVSISSIYFRLFTSSLLVCLVH